MVFSSMMAHAQDIVTLKNGEDVLAKVLEVGTREVKYTLFEEPDGPVYIVNKSDILIIRYESGRNEIFNKTLPGPNREDSVEIVPGMKYRQLKHIYNYREYVPSLTDRYSPGWSGVASFFVPGLGECINGEWGRGLAVVGGNFLLHLIMFNPSVGITIRLRALVDDCTTLSVFIISASRSAIAFLTVDKFARVNVSPSIEYDCPANIARSA